MKEPSSRHLEEMSCLGKAMFEELSEVGQSFRWKIKIIAKKEIFIDWNHTMYVALLSLDVCFFQVDTVNICQTSVLAQTDCVLYEKTASSIIHI